MATMPGVTILLSLLLVNLCLLLHQCQAESGVVSFSANFAAESESATEDCKCPHRNGKCCSHTNKFCCPLGFKCDVNSPVASPTCFAENSDDITLAIPAAVDSIQVCPDGRSRCGDRQTCCHRHNRHFNCCPITNAVCCKDHKHCCPHGSTCNSKKKVCDTKEGSFLKMIERFNPTPMDTQLAFDAPTDDQPGSDSSRVKCPGSKWKCKTADACCKRPDGKYNCCPKGKKCSAETKWCAYPGVPCPGSKWKCKTADACCKRPDGKYNCCPKDKKCSADTKWCAKSKFDLFQEIMEPSTSIQKSWCPGKKWHCSVKDTCCKRPDGKYNCCPKGKECSATTSWCHSGVKCPNSTYQCPTVEACCQIPGNKHTHSCCSKGQKCSAASNWCQKSSADSSGQSDMKEMELDNRLKDLPCKDNQTRCADGQTCCQSFMKERFGCCPLAKAVCCSDHLHCCAANKKCGPSGQCGSLMDPVGSLQDAEPIIVNEQATTTCPGSRYKCRGNKTCCKRPDGKYNCCPKGKKCSAETKWCAYPGVPCPGSKWKCKTADACCKRPDGKYNCCPKGKKCSADTKWCARHKLLLFEGFEQFVHSGVSERVEKMYCPGSRWYCQSGQTCCRRPDRKYNCCKQGQYCSASSNWCGKSHNNTCPGSRWKCRQGETCCRRPDRKYNCCKQGQYCSASSNWCGRKHHDITCPGSRFKCWQGETCCKRPDGKYNCCKQGQYCSASSNWCRRSHNNTCPGSRWKCRQGEKCCRRPDRKYNCCKQGQYCSASSNWCGKSHNNTCPGSRWKCRQGETCCRRPDRKYNCCKQGQYCSASSNWCGRKHHDITCPGSRFKCWQGETCCKRPDGKYNCCKRGMECSEQTNYCGRHRVENNEITAAVEGESSVQRVMCPDGKSSCSKETSCCPMENGFGCCLFQKAVCCSDGKHCCPSNSTCDLDTKSCQLSSKLHIPMARKQRSIPVDDTSQKLGHPCPDGTTKCDGSKTCCRTGPGQYGCCPYSQAVCCADMLHCCPTQTKCDIPHRRCLPTVSWEPLLLFKRKN